MDAEKRLPGRLLPSLPTYVYTQPSHNRRDYRLNGQVEEVARAQPYAQTDRPNWTNIVVGQEEAKKRVAIALRNRYRRTAEP